VIRNVGVGLVAAALAGVAVGIATSYLQGILPGAANTLANSGAVWSVVAFAISIATLGASRAAVIAGEVALLGEVVGYYAIATPLRGYTASTSELVLWTAAALVIGPVVGLAAVWWAGGDRWRQLAAAVAMCGIVVGEGLHGIVRIERGGVQWWTEVVIGGSLATIAIVRYGQSTKQRAAGAGAALLVAGVIFVLYGFDRYWALLW